MPKRPTATYPASGLRMDGVAGEVLVDDGHDAVELTVFPEEALSVQVTRMNVPDAQSAKCGLAKEGPTPRIGEQGV